MHLGSVFNLLALCLGMSGCAFANMALRGEAADIIGIHEQRGFDKPQRDGETPQNASMLLLSGRPEPPYYDCLQSGGMANPRKVDLPADVCLYGDFSNTSIILVDGVICPDGSIPYLAIYMNPSCHGDAIFYDWQYGQPGSFCYFQQPWWNNTHLLQKYSLIFRCQDVPVEDRPEKFIDGDTADPVIESAPCPSIHWAEPYNSAVFILSSAMLISSILLISYKIYQDRVLAQTFSRRYLDLKEQEAGYAASRFQD